MPSTAAAAVQRRHPRQVILAKYRIQATEPGARLLADVVANQMS